MGTLPVKRRDLDGETMKGVLRHPVRRLPNLCAWPCESTRLWPTKVPTHMPGPDVVGEE